MRVAVESLWAALLEGRRAYGVGTVRTWKSGRWQKTREGWLRLFSPKGIERRQAARQEMGSVVSDLSKMVSSGALGPRKLGEHVKIAREFLKRHEAGFPAALARVSELATLAAPGAKVSGRTKTLSSTLGKIIRKPSSYPTADKLQDGTGIRVVTNSLSEVGAVVGAIRKRWKVLSEDDYITKPLGAYRSHHLIIEDEDGLPKEVQVRTARQMTFANWSHKVYKPKTALERRALLGDRDEIESYSREMSAYYYEQDKAGRRIGRKPPCPDSVRTHFGCL